MSSYVMLSLTTAQTPQIPLPSETSKLKCLNLCINIILHAVLYELETWPRTLKEKKQTEGTTGEGADRKLLNYEEEGSKEVEKTA
jgi:hypothetical protein